MMPECRLIDLGTVDYPKACRIQKKIVDDVIRGHASHTLILCQHPHVITMGRRTKREHILATAGELQRLNVQVSWTDRGGDVTYHGPGQVVLYPIFDLRREKDLYLFLRKLEQAAIDALRDNFGLNAHRKHGLTGVWVGPYKVASIGIGVRHWVTYHGLSLNVRVDKQFFSLIKPCGMDLKMASITDFFKDDVSMEMMKDLLVQNMEKVFCLEIDGGVRRW